MSLDVSKLQAVRDLPDGGVMARCPACAEAGQDKSGEHLRIYPGGRFGCCVFPGDAEHRRRIYALTGDERPRAIKVKVASSENGTARQPDVLGRLGRLFSSGPGNGAVWDGRDGGTQVERGSSQVEAVVGAVPGTPGTPFEYLRAYARARDTEDSVRKLKEFCDPVPSVPGRDQRLLPHLLGDGTLVIPFESPERFHWWRGGQSVSATLAELRGKERNATTV